MAEAELCVRGSPMRLFMWRVSHSEYFLNWVLVLILVSCVQLAWETYAEEPWEWAVLGASER